MRKFVIFTDSCSDLSTEFRKKYNIEYYRMGIVVDGKEMPATLDWDIYSPKEFYDWMRAGKKVKTIQVSVEEFVNRSKPFLDKGFDIMYISCSSALSGSINTFLSIVVPELQQQYKDAKLIGIDSLAGSTTGGIIAYQALKQRALGKSIEEVRDYIEQNKLRSNQFATVDTLTYLKNAGRIKASKAFMGNLFHKKPIFISDRKGNNFVIGTVTGTKNSLNALIDGVKNSIIIDDDNVAYVGHGDDPVHAEELKQRLIAEVGVKNVVVNYIGPIVGVTCGPGVLATFCYGKEVTIAEGDK